MWPARTLLLLTLSCCGPAHAADPEPSVLVGKVTKIIDGDTVDVLLQSGRIRVRLHGIDAPERDQPGGTEAREWLQQHLQDRQVLLEPVTQDRYDRLVAIVHDGDVVVNDELVRSGHAWAYRQYLRKADRHLCEKESSARRHGAGIWAAVAPHAPWEFRGTNGRGPFTDFSRQTASDCARYGVSGAARP